MVRASFTIAYLVGLSLSAACYDSFDGGNVSEQITTVALTFSPEGGDTQ